MRFLSFFEPGKITKLSPCVCVGTLGNKAIYFVSFCIYNLVAVGERLFQSFFRGAYLLYGSPS